MITPQSCTIFQDGSGNCNRDSSCGICTSYHGGLSTTGFATAASVATYPPSLACMVLQQHDYDSVTVGCRAADCQENFSETAIRNVQSPSSLLRMCPTKTYSVFAMLLRNSVNPTTKATLAAVAKPVVDRPPWYEMQMPQDESRLQFPLPSRNIVHECSVIISTSLTEMNYSVQLD
jgi:hypothetical protein